MHGGPYIEYNAMIEVDIATLGLLLSPSDLAINMPPEFTREIFQSYVTVKESMKVFLQKKV